MSRLSRFQGLLAEAEVDCAVIVPGPNLYYLTGIEVGVSERALFFFVPREGEPVVVCPELEGPKFSEHGYPVHEYPDSGGPVAGLWRVGSGLGLRNRCLGVEYLSMRLLEWDYLNKALGSFNLKDAIPMLSQLRMIKDEDEVAAIREAARIADLGMAVASEAIKPGVTERQVARTVEEQVRANHGELLEVMVASGPRSAVPHAKTSDRVIQAGDVVWVDLVLKFRGYVSDITRTFAVGELDGDLTRAWRTVERAAAAAREACRPGVSLEDIDATAREIIEAEGFGPNFTHRTGHGIGLEVHEEPYVVAGNRQLLRAGMTFTVEPGIYIPGLGGVRIEDDLLITEEGVEVLTSFERGSGI